MEKLINVDKIKTEKFMKKFSELKEIEKSYTEEGNFNKAEKYGLKLLYLKNDFLHEIANNILDNNFKDKFLTLIKEYPTNADMDEKYYETVNFALEVFNKIEKEDSLLSEACKSALFNNEEFFDFNYAKSNGIDELKTRKAQLNTSNFLDYREELDYLSSPKDADIMADVMMDAVMMDGERMIKNYQLYKKTPSVPKYDARTEYLKMKDFNEKQKVKLIKNKEELKKSKTQDEDFGGVGPSRK